MLNFQHIYIQMEKPMLNFQHTYIQMEKPMLNFHHIYIQMEKPILNFQHTYIQMETLFKLILFNRQYYRIRKQNRFEITALKIKVSLPKIIY